jgi:RimJ/RimL family protein N-acetyltransferase
MIHPLMREPLDRLETARLVLRTPAGGDGAMLCEAVTETLPALRRYLGNLSWVAAEPSVEGLELFCRNAVANFHARKDFPYLVLQRDTGRLVGVCGLHRPDWATPKAEVGYWCRASASGRGYITEAVGALAGYAFERLGMVRLSAVTDEENIASRRVAERTGFALEGVLRADTRAPDGSLRNNCVYARLRPGA